jgi:uncharacterized protein YidB (DUF937 family)
MGLMDILNGMENGPRGQKQPPAPGSKPGGMSPLMMALMALLAYKAYKGATRGAVPGAPPSGGTSNPSANEASTPGGGLGDLLNNIFGRGAGAGIPGGGSATGGGGLGDILGNLLPGGSAGSILNGGLGNILKELQQQGQGKTVQSWIDTGANQPISSRDLESALGADTLDELAARSGVPRDQLAAGLSQHLPELVDQLTPHGRLPTQEEASRWV